MNLKSSLLPTSSIPLTPSFFLKSSHPSLRPKLSNKAFGCVWLREESEKREISERECERREIDKKYSRFVVLFVMRERREK